MALSRLARQRGGGLRGEATPACFPAGYRGTIERMMAEKMTDPFAGWRRQVVRGGKVRWTPSRRDLAILRASRLNLQERRRQR